MQYKQSGSVIFFFMIAVISLLQYGCNDSSSSLGTGTSPVIISVSPDSNSMSALVTTDVHVTFRDAMDPATVISAFELRLNSIPVAATVSYDVASKTASLVPADRLLPGEQYIASVDAMVEDIYGVKPLTNDYVWSFITSPEMTLVSKNLSGVTSNNTSQAADIDATGRYIVFESTANNLTADDTVLGRSHIYRKDTVSGQVLLVSSNANGVQANNHAYRPRISSNGRYVVFESSATNLDSNVFSAGITQIYRKDLQDGTVELVSRRNINNTLVAFSTGSGNASVSDDGRYILFQSSSGGFIVQVYRKDMSDESVEIISRNAADEAGINSSGNAKMSADGRHIVFESTAANFPSGNGLSNIYYADMDAAQHALELMSVATGGGAANAASYQPSISDDGLFIVFHSAATDLAGIDNNGYTDVFMRYRPLALTSLLSANPDTGNSGNGNSYNAQISGNAEAVVFESLATDLAADMANGVTNIMVRDLTSWPVIIISTVAQNTLFPPPAASQPGISADGSYISFHSNQSYGDDTDINRLDVFRAYNSTQP